MGLADWFKSGLSVMMNIPNMSVHTYVNVQKDGREGAGWRVSANKQRNSPPFQELALCRLPLEGPEQVALLRRTSGQATPCRKVAVGQYRPVSLAPRFRAHWHGRKPGYR